MKVQSLHTMVTPEGIIPSGTIFDTTRDRARNWSRSGFVREVKPTGPQETKTWQASSWQGRRSSR